MSLPEELALLRLYEVHSANSGTENEHRQNAPVSLEERRRAVRDAQFVIGAYVAGQKSGVKASAAKGRLAFDQSEPIRLACSEEALKVRYEVRQGDQKQRKRIDAIRARMEGKGAAGQGVSLEDGAKHSTTLEAIACMKQGSVVLRLMPDVKRSIDYRDLSGGDLDGGGIRGGIRGRGAPACDGGHVDERQGQQQGQWGNKPVITIDEPPSKRMTPNTTAAMTTTRNNCSGFGSAKSEYIQVMKKQGKRPTFEGQTKGQAGTGHNNNSISNRNMNLDTNRKVASMDIESQTKHLPPYMRKALASMNSIGNKAGGNNGNNIMQKKRPGATDDKPEGPISARTYELLGLDPDEELPDELSRIDPRMIEQVCNEVIDSSASVAWEDIAGQEAAKRLIQEVVVWPMMNPDIFKGARAPPKGILLFGPPGTGKTLLGKAIASNIDASFFAISASSLTSKWIGDGEKMVKALFAVAGWMAPSVIFIDEIDSLLSARKSEGEHESSRRLKTEILVQMEGCDPASAERKVLLVGATNRPEELDEAARRRMPKQMYIPLPCEKAREEMIHRVMTNGSIASQLSAQDIAKVVAKTEGYSGSDMKNLIQEACQGPIREAVRRAGAAVATLKEQDLRPVVLKDFAAASKAQRASTEPSEVLRYIEYNDKHGAKLVEDGEDDGDDCSVSEGW